MENLFLDCTIEKHESYKKNLICIEPNCPTDRLMCSQCQFDLHMQHRFIPFQLFLQICKQIPGQCGLFKQFLKDILIQNGNIPENNQEIKHNIEKDHQNQENSTNNNYQFMKNQYIQCFDLIFDSNQIQTQNNPEQDQNQQKQYENMEISKGAKIQIKEEEVQEEQQQEEESITTEPSLDDIIKQKKSDQNKSFSLKRENQDQQKYSFQENQEREFNRIQTSRSREKLEEPNYRRENGNRKFSYQKEKDTKWNSTIKSHTDSKWETTNKSHIDSKWDQWDTKSQESNEKSFRKSSSSKYKERGPSQQQYSNRNKDNFNGNWNEDRQKRHRNYDEKQNQNGNRGRGNRYESSSRRRSFSRSRDRSRDRSYNKPNKRRAPSPFKDQQIKCQDANTLKKVMGNKNYKDNLKAQLVPMKLGIEEDEIDY